MTAVAHAATPSRARPWWALPALAAIIAGAGVAWSLAPYLVGVFHDDGVYALLARSIAAGDGFHYSHLPGAPAATHYPPLYPLVLAALWHFAPDFPANLSVLLGANAVFAAIAAGGVATFAMRRLGWSAGAAAVVALVATMATPILTLAGALLSEILFLALLWPALLIAERMPSSTQARHAVTAGAVIGGLMLLRTHAIALLLALVLVLVIRRRHGAALTAFAVALAVQLPWVLWSQFATPRVPVPLEGAYGSYLGWFIAGMRDGGPTFVMQTAWINARELGLLVRDRFTTGIAPVDAVTLTLVLAAMLAGARSFAHRAPITVLFFSLYVAIVIVWPYTPWRFAWAVWPLALLMALEGVRDTAARYPAWGVIARVAAVLPFLGFVRTELHSYASRAWRAPARQASSQLLPVLAWARAGTAPTDVLLVEGEQVIALYANRMAAPPIAFTAREYARPSSARAAQSLAEMLRAVPATHLVTLTPDVQRAALAMRDSVISLTPVPAPAGVAAFEVRR